MINYRRVTPRFSISSQIRKDDFPTLARDGYTLVINNRPDGEEAGQLSSAEAEAAARDNGISYAYLPLTVDTITPQTAVRLKQLVDDNDGLTLCYCRSGTRSMFLWAIHAVMDQTHTLSDVEIIARGLGYDLRAFLTRIETFMSKPLINGTLPQTNSAALLDLEQLGRLKDTLGEEELNQMLDMLDSETHAQMQALRSAHQRGDIAEQRQVLHTLKGLAGNFGLARLGTLVTHYYEDAAPESLSKVDVPNVASGILAETLTALKEYRDRQKSDARQQVNF